MNLKKDWTALPPKGLFFHMLFNRHFRQCASIATAVTTDSPLFNPLFLHIRLAAGRTDKDPFFVEHPTLFLHSLLTTIWWENRTTLGGIARIQFLDSAGPARYDAPWLFHPSQSVFSYRLF
jgi:hypothetical protein